MKIMSDRKFYRYVEIPTDGEGKIVYRSVNQKESFLKFDMEGGIFLVSEEDVQAIKDGERNLVKKAYKVRRTNLNSLQGRRVNKSHLSDIINLIVDESLSTQPTKAPLPRYF